MCSTCRISGFVVVASASATILLTGCGFSLQDGPPILPATVTGVSSDDFDLVATSGATSGMWSFSMQPKRSLASMPTFEWDFGDGVLVVGQNQIHTFQETGTHLITVRALDSDGTVLFVLSQDIDVVTVNRAPLVDVVTSQSAGPNQLVFLDGGGSSDPDGDSLNFAWKQITGPPVFLVNPNSAVASFVTPITATGTRVVFTLDVNDGILSAQADTVVDVQAPLDPGQFPAVCVFDVTVGGDTDVSPGLDGQRPLSAVATVHSADGLPLPGGTVTWMVDGSRESGTLDTHATISRVLSSAGRHTFSVSLLLVSGLTIGCSTLNTGTSEAMVDVWPVIAGKVLDTSGKPLTGVTVSANAGGTTSVSDIAGEYTVHVPYLWTGRVTAQHVDYTFANPTRDFETVDTDLADEPFVALVEPVEPVACASDLECDDGNPCTDDLCNAESACTHSPLTGTPCGDDGLYCSGVEICLAGVCTSGGDPCSSGQSCDEQADECVVGLGIFGTISLVETVGARPKFGQWDLDFTGTGAWVGANYVVTTDVDGLYAHVVPTGWTGTVSAADPSRMFLTPESRDYSTPIESPQLDQNFSAWTAPIGIPSPDFGIKESHDMYADATFDFGSGPEPYPLTANGPYTHYVDNTHSQATDSNNAYGTPALPRLSIPRGLAAGSVVEVHGGPYNTNLVQERWLGTAQSPIFILGVDMPRFASSLRIYNTQGSSNSYVIVDGFSLFAFSVGAASHHIALRNCDLVGSENGGGTNISDGSFVGPGIHHVVFFNNTIHDNGIWDPAIAEGDRDIHGVTIGWQSLIDNVWIIDNHIFHNEGDAVQVNGGPGAPQTNINHIYLARNDMHHNKQTGVTLKSCTDVIISQNDVYGHQPSTSATGAAMGFSDAGPEVCWFIFNRIHDSALGFKFSEEGGSQPGPHYIIGNLIYDIHGDGGPLTGNWTQPGQAFADFKFTAEKYIVANTIYNTDYGYGIWSVWQEQNGGGPVTFANNIFSQMTTTDAAYIYVGHTGSPGIVTVTNNLFDGPFRIKWGAANYTTLALFQATTGQGAGSLAGDARFSDPANADFQLPADSPAIDAGGATSVYAAFLSRYGIDIQVDIDGMRLPVDGNADGAAVVDMGAYEFRRP